MLAAVYRTDTGALHSVGELTEQDVAALPAEFAASEIGGPTDGQVWDAQARAFVPDPMGPKLTRVEFASRFTAEEYVAISESTDVNIRFFLERLRLAEEVQPGHALVKMALGYMTMIGLLTPERAAEIGAL